jgi:hypothetical protein
LARPGLRQLEVIAGAPGEPDREQHQHHGDDHEVPAREHERPGAARDRAHVDQTEHRGEQRADETDADQPVRPVDEVLETAAARVREDVEDERRHERTDGDRDEQRVERVATRA